MEIKAERIEDKKLKKQKTKERNKKLFSYLKSTKGPLIIGFTAAISLVALDLINPYIIGEILDNNLKEGIGAINRGEFNKLVFLLALTFAITSLMRYLTRRFLTRRQI